MFVFRSSWIEFLSYITNRKWCAFGIKAVDGPKEFYFIIIFAENCPVTENVALRMND